jgi:hypothetical protein
MSFSIQNSKIIALDLGDGPLELIASLVAIIYDFQGATHLYHLYPTLLLFLPSHYSLSPHFGI